MTQRNPPARDPDYLDFVRALPSVVSGQFGCEAHHPISERYSSQKVSDYLCIPLTRDEHRKLHEGWRAWEALHGAQRAHSAATLHLAIRRADR